MTTTTTTPRTNVATKENKKLFSFKLNWMQENAIQMYCDQFGKLFGKSYQEQYLGNPNPRTNAETMMMSLRHMCKNHNKGMRFKYVEALKALELDAPASSHMSEVIALYDKMYARERECFGDPVWKEAYLKQLKLQHNL